jgi:hypothetical protein
MNSDTQVCLFAILLYVVIILYIYGMHRMSEMSKHNLRGTLEF